MGKTNYLDFGLEKSCRDCIHYWIRPATIIPACGKAAVTQFRFHEARSEKGDCKPEGIFFVKRYSTQEERK